MKIYFREADGHTYYFKEGVLFGAPTFIDGTVDYQNEMAVSLFAEPLSSEERIEIEGALYMTC